MKTEKKRSFLDRLKAMIKDAEAEEKEKEKEEEEEEVKDETPAERKERYEREKSGEEEEKEKTSDADVFEQRLSRIEAIVNKLVPLEEAEHGQQLDADPEGKEKEEETVDTIIEPEEIEKVDTGTVLTGDSLKQVIARAEILAPGIAIPTGDAAKGKHVVPRLQLKAIQTAMTTDTGKAIVEPFLMGRELGKLTFDQLGMVFTGAAELMRARNNASLMSSTPTKDFGKPASVEAINAKNKEFWAKNK